MRIVCYCFLLILLVSCSKNKFPDDVMQPEKMQAVFWDVLRADVLVTDYSKKSDTAKKLIHDNIALQKKIFQIHGITKEQFYTSFDFYSKNPDLMSVVLDSMVAMENRNKIETKNPTKIKPITNE